jgi:hypothetical protein
MHHLYLKPEMPLSRFCSTVNYKPWFPWLHHYLYVFPLTVRYMLWFPWLQIVCGKDCVWYIYVNPTMLNNPSTLIDYAEWYRYCIHLATLNLSHFKFLKLWDWKLSHRSLLHHLLTKFHSNQSAGSKRIRRPHRHLHTDRRKNLWFDKRAFIFGM